MIYTGIVVRLDLINAWQIFVYNWCSIYALHIIYNDSKYDDVVFGAALATAAAATPYDGVDDPP